MFLSAGSMANDDTQPARGRVEGQAVVETAVNALLFRCMKPSAIPTSARFESVSAMAMALTWVEPAVIVLARNHLAAPLSVRQIKSPPVHNRRGSLGSITKGVINKPPSLIPAVASPNVPPPSVLLTNVMSGKEAKSVFGFVKSTAEYPP